MKETLFLIGFIASFLGNIWMFITIHRDRSLSKYWRESDQKELESLKEAVEDLKDPIQADLRKSFRKSVDSDLFSGYAPWESPDPLKQAVDKMKFNPQEKVVGNASSIQEAWDSEVVEFCNDTLSKFEERLDRAIQEQDVKELRTTHNLLCMHLMNKIDQVTARSRKRKKVN